MVEILLLSHLPFAFVSGFQYYRCILLVPDIYNRQHIKEVVNVLLLNMGFSGIAHIHTCVVYFGKAKEPSRLSPLSSPQRLSCCDCVYVCSDHRPSGVGMRHIWQWVEQCLCRGCWRPEDQSLLCRGRCVPPELKVGWGPISDFIYVYEIIKFIDIADPFYIWKPEQWPIVDNNSECLKNEWWLRMSITWFVPSACGTLQAVFGIRWLRRDPHFLLAPAEGRLSLQGLSAVQQTGLSAAAASERDLLPSGPSGWLSWEGTQR